MSTVVERDVQPELGTGIQQPLTYGIFADHTRGRVGGNAVRAIGEQLPRFTVVVREIDVRLVIAQQIAIRRVVRRTLAVRRRLDPRHTPTVFEALRRHARPRLAIVTRDRKRAVVRTGPDHALFQRRLRNRVQRAVELLARHVARNRLATAALATLREPREVWGDLLPRCTVVARAVQKLRTIVQHLRIVRRQRHRRGALHAVVEIAAVVAIQRLRTDPVVLRHSGVDVHQGVLPLAVAMNEILVARMRNDRTRFTARTRAHRAHVEHVVVARHDVRAVVLLRHVELVRKRVVEPHPVKLGRGLYILRAPRLASIVRHVGAAIVRLHHRVAVGGVDPDVVIVAVWRAERRHRLAAVGTLVKRFGAREHHVGIRRIGAERRVVERTRDQPRRAVHERPARTRIIGAIQAAARHRFNQSVDAVRVGRRDGKVALAGDLIRQPTHHLREAVAPVRALVETAFARAGDDRPRLPFDAIHPRVHDLRIAGLQLDVHRAGAVAHVQRLLPRLAAIGGLEDAAVVVRLEDVAIGRHPDDVGIGGVDSHSPDLSGGGQPCELPGRTVVDALVHAAAGGHVTTHAVRAGADVDDVRVRLRHGDRADRAEGDLVVGDEIPRVAAVRGAHYTTAGHAGIERFRLRRHTGDRGDATATRVAHQAIAEPLEKRGIGRGHHRR